MKQMFILLLVLLVVSHIYATVNSNANSNTAKTENKSKSGSTAETKLTAQTNTNTNLSATNQVKVASTAAANAKVSSTTEASKHKFVKPNKKKNKKKKKKSKTKIIKIKRKTYKDPIKVLKTGWLRISTTMFRKTNKFPPIILPNGKEIKIKTNKKYFRINEAYVAKSDSPDLPPKKNYFWFRLSGKHLYYSMTKKDINILGDVTVKNIVTSYASQATKNEENCFKVVDREGRNWKLCAQNLAVRGEWVCFIKDMLGKPDPACKNPALANTVVVERKVSQPIILIPLSSPKCNENWDYNSKGSDWNCECSEGKFNQDNDNF